MLSNSLHTHSTRALTGRPGMPAINRQAVGNDVATPNASINKLLTRSAAATYLGVQPQTLAVWACTQRYALPYVKIGRRVMYRLADLEAFVVANRHGNEAVIGGADV